MFRESFGKFLEEFLEKPEEILWKIYKIEKALKAISNNLSKVDAGQIFCTI